MQHSFKKLQSLNSNRRWNRAFGYGVCLVVIAGCGAQAEDGEFAESGDPAANQENPTVAPVVKNDPLNEPDRPVETEEVAAPNGELGVTSQALQTWRTDQVGEITPDSGSWGDWQQAVYCNNNTWAVGFAQRVEPHGGEHFDDTELNSVRLVCANKAGTETETITSHAGWWGTWSNKSKCSSSGFVTGARLKNEVPQGNGDDTGGNDTQMSCSAGGNITASNGGTFGSWSQWSTCPTGSAVCGLKIRLEAQQGDGDDTAMNGLTLYCCTKS
ncbi:MAG TPA: hypothetical protein VHM70_18075 [Polyangiaceae bacterium]|nr:hypothetical protein [Polyangiaceae bacterium]